MRMAFNAGWTTFWTCAAAFLLCQVSPLVAQQPPGSLDFPAWDELPGNSGPGNSGAPQSPRTSPWPTAEPASTPLSPRFDDGSLPDPFRINDSSTDDSAIQLPRTFGPGRNTQPISQTRPLSDGRRFPEYGQDRSEFLNGQGNNRSDRSLRDSDFEYVAPGTSEPVRKYLNAEQPLSEGEDQPRFAEPEFSWSTKQTSPADLTFASSTVFLHNNGFMERPERAAYLELIANAAYQRQQLVQASQIDTAVTRDPRAVWEESFYRYPEARRMAWANGKLQSVNAPRMLGNLPDPFAKTGSDKPSAKTSPSKYSLLNDIAQYPGDFVGRPIVLYGRFTAGSDVRLDPDPLAERTDAERYGAGRSATDRQTAAAFFGQYDNKPLQSEKSGQASVGNNDGLLPPVPKAQHLLRGSLSSLKGGENIAMIDTKGLVTPSGGLQGISEAWRAEANIPVMIKGWVVKHWKDNKPLIYCESMRLITPRPQVDLIRGSTVDKRRLRDEETWLYYETLKQLELTSHRLQKEIAAAALRQRVDGLMRDIMASSKADLVRQSDLLTSGTISETVHKRRRAALERRLKQRLTRYKDCLKNPEEFKTYVDMFQHPEAWHGDLVTLRGHVRHIVSYPADKVLFGSPQGARMLHELWLFTDDSQHNPAVIVTPNLPADFPTEADVVDYVTVTGCFFKRYVYGAQDTDRIAPLILASHVGWQPTVDQVQAMVASGLVSPGSPRAVRAAAIAGDRTSDAAILLGVFLVMLVLMILWGRAQREERDRVHLRKVVNEVPVFENSTVDRYASLLSDLPDDLSRDSAVARHLPTNKYAP